MRAATFDDLPALLELSRAYHQEAHSRFAFDAAYVSESFRVKTIDTIEGICLVMENNGALTGFLAATVSMFFSAPVKLAVELAWYVHPDHRGQGSLLIDDFEIWAKFKGCVACSLGMNEFDDPARTRALVRLYERRGYRAFERGFLKEF